MTISSLAPRSSFLLLLFAAPLAAQSVSPKVDSLVARTYRGDTKARSDLGTIARGMMIDVGSHRVDAPTARAAAAVGMAMMYPTTAPDAPIARRDIEWRGGVVRALRQAMAADSGDRWSAARLEEITPYPYLWFDAPKELAIFRAMGRRHPDLQGELAATRIRLELERGSIDSAARAFAALPHAGLSTAQRKYLEAEVLFAQGKDEFARQAYFAGASAIADSADAADYFLSIKTIAKPGERDEWNAMGYVAGVREAWLQTFWAKRDLEDARALGTRLPEQFRRWRVALGKYRFDEVGSIAEAIPVPRTPVSIEAGLGDILFPFDPAVSELAYQNRFLPLSRVVDDRGLMVLRMGEPLLNAGSTGVHQLDGTNMIWASPTGALILGFTRAASFAGDLRWGMVARNYPVGDLNTLCGIDARFCVLLGGGTASINRLRMEWMEMRARGETMEGNPETFTRSLNAIVQAFGIPQGGTLVVIGVPVRGIQSNADSLQAARSFATRVRVVVGDTIKGAILSSLDTLRVWRSATAVGSDAFLNAYFVVPAPVGDWSVSVVVGDTNHAAGTGRRFRSVPVAAFNGKSLELSDPILGREGAGLSWRNGAETIPLNPTNAWRTEESVILTYQTDGMVVGHQYTTRYELWKASGKPKAPDLVITSTGVANESRATTRRELALKQLSPGDYRLVVQVRDATTGAESVRERRIAVRK